MYRKKGHLMKIMLPFLTLVGVFVHVSCVEAGITVHLNLAADDFDAAADERDAFADPLNENFMALETAIGGSFSTPHQFSAGEVFFAPSLRSAAAALRLSDLLAAAGHFDDAANEMDAFADPLNENFMALETTIGSSFSTPHQFSAGEVFFAPSLRSAAADLQNAAVAVPEPSLELLLGISLVGLVGVGAVRRRLKKE